MSIIGVTVGTPISPEKIEEKINPVKTVNGKAPDENGNVEVEVKENTNITESDPTVPSWAKQPTKPSYSKSEVGLGNVDNVKQYSASNPPPYPVSKVNGKTGDVKLTASDVGARPSTWMPDYSEVGADKSGTASSAVSTHNTNKEAHNDLRLLIEGLTTRLNALANSDDTTLDQMKEVVDYIKSNRDLIGEITTTKINYADIINDLATNVTDKPLSAAQGVALKALIDGIIVPTKLSEFANDAGYLTSFTEEDPTVPFWAKQTNKPNYTAEEVGAVSLDGLADAINIALATAKESGEFDGKDGEDGYTPVRGTDYWNPLDEAEWAAYIASELAKRGQLKPEFANSVEECTDTTKLYVLPDGYIWAYMEKESPEVTVPNFTNQIEEVGYTPDTYLSSSSGNTSAKTGYGTTGLIKIPSVTSHDEGQVVLYLANVEALPTDNYVRIGFYKSDKSFNKATTAPNGVNGYTQYKLNYWLDENNQYIVKFDLSTCIMTQIGNGASADDYQYIRICASGLDGESIVSLNNPIEYITIGGESVNGWTDTGHAFVPADYEDRIIAVEKSTAKNAKDIGELKEKANELDEKIAEIQVGNNTIPEGVKTAVSSLVDKAMSREGNQILRFLISSDAHQNNDNNLITNGTIELGQAQAEILNLIGVDFVANLGDIAWGAQTNTVAEVVEQIKTYKRFTAIGLKGECQLWCEGNHDDGNYSLETYPDTPKLTASAINTLLYSEHKGVVYDLEHAIDGYCYKDFEHLKVRVICLNTEQGTGDGGVVESYQIEWLEDVALNMTDKTDWQVVTLAHHPFSYGTTSLNAVVDIIDAFIKNGGKYIGHFHGHAHAFSVVKMQKNVNGTFTDINAWEICIPNACYTRNNQYLGNANTRLARYSTPTTYNKTGEDGKRTSFNLVTVCLDTKKIYADNYGAGIDREISY